MQKRGCDMSQLDELGKKQSIHWIVGTALALASLCLGATFANAATITAFNEGFETDGLGTRYTLENASDDGSVFFARRQEFSAGTRTSGGDLDGGFFFSGRDIDAAGDGTGVGVGESPLASDEGRITFNAFSIAGLGGLTISMAAAQGVDEFEFDNVLLIEVKIDDGEFEAIGGFRGTFTNSPGRYFQGDENTLPDHFVEERLVSSFTTNSWDIPGSGDTMQIRIKMNLNGANEEYAIDNLTVTGDDALAGFALAINNAVISETAGAGVATVTVTLDNPAPGGGVTLDINLVSPLAVSGPEGEISVPASVTIPEGMMTGTFDVDAVADNRFDGDVGIRIFVSGDGFHNNFVTITTTNVDGLPSLILNEFLADVPGSIAEDLFGDANGDGVRNGGEDEFVEIVNISGDGTAVNLSGWIIADNIGPRHIFPLGSVLEDGRAIVVFGGATPVGVFGGAIVQTASQGNLGWSNSGDTINLDAGGASVFAVVYTGELGATDTSPVRDPELTFGDPDPDSNYILHNVAPGTDGALFSPGTQNDGVTPFGDFNFEASLDLSATTVSEDAGAAAVTGTITLNNPAPAGGLAMNIDSLGAPDRIDFSGPGVVESFIENEALGRIVRVITLTIAEGATQGMFNVDVLDDGVLSGDRDWPIIVKENNTIPDLDVLTVTESLPNPFTFVINELYQDSDGAGADANKNGISNEGLDDQFVEIVNVSGSAVDISDWQLGSVTSDNFGINRTRIEHEFPAGTVLDDQGSVLIFGGVGGVDGHLARMNDPEDLGPSFGNAIVQVANAGTNGVDLAGDEAEGFTSQLFNEHDFLMAEANYVRADAEQGQSLTRAPDITGDFFSPDGPSFHFDVSPTFLPFSPGAMIDGTAFPGNGRVEAEGDLFGGVILGDGWRESAWFGFYNVGFEPWIFHFQHGFQFVFAGATEGEVFLYDLETEDWWFTSASTYPNVYSFNRAAWVFYFLESAAPRTFVDLTTGEFYDVP